MVEISLYIDIDELCESHRVNEETILEIVEYGIAAPSSGKQSSEWVFDLDSAHWIKKAIRLHQQFLIDWVAISMVIDLMKSNEKLAKENSQLHTRLERH